MTIKELVKNYWNQKPCNSEESDKPVGTKEYFEDILNKKYSREPHIVPFANFEQWKGKRVLEIGCGIGLDSVNFAKAGAYVTAVEFSDKSLEICKKHFESFGLTGTFYLADAEQLSQFVPVEPYDLIYSFGVLHHTPNPENAFEEIKKYMNKDSELRVMLYHRNSMYVINILGRCDYNANVDELVARQSEAQKSCPIVYTYKIDDIPKLLNGFDILSIDVDFIGDLGGNVGKVWNELKKECPDLYKKFEKIYGWNLLIKAKLRS